MRPLQLLSIAIIIAFSGCNAGEIELLKQQVQELKAEKDALQQQLTEANAKLAENTGKLAKLEALEEQRQQQMESIKELMPNARDLGEIFGAAKDLGLPELKNFDKDALINKAQQGIDKAAKDN